MAYRIVLLAVLFAVASVQAASVEELAIRDAITRGKTYQLKKDVVLSGNFPVIPPGKKVTIIGVGKKPLTINGLKRYTLFKSSPSGAVTLVLKNLNIINAVGTAVELSASGSKLTIDKVSFKTSKKAISGTGTTATITNSQFSGHTNTAVSVLAGTSGIPAFTFSKCKFSGNKADGNTGGGALYVDGRAFVTATSTTFDSNSAPDSVGGAVRLVEFATGKFSSCTFTKNSAPDGGAVAAFNAYFRTFKCLFKGNSAGVGGAIRMRSDGEGDNTHLQTVFDGNRASNYGGAFVVNADISLTFCSCTFKANTAKGVANNGFNENSVATIFTFPFTEIPLVTYPPTSDPTEFAVGTACPKV